jgi:mono/diheme cytochrome c family protein
VKTILCIAAVIALVCVVAGPASAAADGKALYKSKCAMCHGQDGVPAKMGAGSKAFNDPEFKKTATVESIVKDTHEGKGKMKPMKSVTDEEAKAIAQEILAMPAAK